ncbi:hypothetical protein ALQ26_00019, partial [Pseudomonas amygdali pv. lachrymans]
RRPGWPTLKLRSRRPRRTFDPDTRPQLSPGRDQHRDCLHTNDLRPLKALAEEFGCDVVARQRPAPKPLLAALAHLAAESGDVKRLIYDATLDNHISQHEKAQGEKAIQEAIDSLQVLRESLRAA